MEWSAQQQGVFDWITGGRGSAVVVAVAGAGKTTTIVHGMSLMEGAVFGGAYNTKMAGELKKRVAHLPHVTAGTFHSAGFRTLRSASGPRLEVDKDKVRNIVAALVADTPREDWAPAVVALVGLAKQRGLGVRGCVEAPKRRDWADLIERYDVLDRIEEDVDPNRLIDVAVAALDASNADRERVDFDDMIYLPLLRGLRFFKYDWVVADEVQDVNATRRELARRMLKPGGRFVGVGDPHQAIFGFTGADSDSMSLVAEMFGAQTLELTVTYRCPKAVVAAARAYVDHIRAAATAPDGEHTQMDYREMLEFVAPGDAVLCRYNRHIVELCFRLIRAGRPAKIEGRDVGAGLAALVGRWKVRSLDALRTRLDRWIDRETAKATAKGNDARAEVVRDQYETLLVLVERGAETGVTTVGGLQAMIRTMFDDVGDDNSRLIVLSSVHRAKGLEWDRVFVLGRAELMPSRAARQDWQRVQENNLCYVALTRAKRHIVDVALPVGTAVPKAREAA